MSIFNTAYLAEAAENECNLQIDSDTDGIAAAISKEFNQIEELEKDVFEYCAPMIPIVQKPTSEGTKYIAEFDMLQKLAKDQHIDICKAFDSICESNSIDRDDLYILLRGNITKCVTESVNKSNIGNVRKALDAIRALKEDNINLVREIIDDDESIDEPEGVDADKIPTDPKDDTINTSEDYEDKDDVDNINNIARKMTGE